MWAGCAARFVSDLVRNPEDRFSYDAAHIISVKNDIRTPSNFAVNTLYSLKLKLICFTMEYADGNNKQ